MANLRLPPRSSFLVQGKEKLVSPVTSAYILIKYFNGNLEYNERVAQWYLYEASYPGVWGAISEIRVLSLLQSIFSDLQLLLLTKSSNYLLSVKQTIQLDPSVLRTEYPVNPPNFFVFRNCVLTPKGPQPHSKDPHCYSCVPYDYDPSAGCPTFLSFLNDFCSGHADRIKLIRAFMRCCFESRTHVQKFIEFVGQGKTGKSTFQMALMAFVGLENCVVTTLRDLNTNVFEGSLLQHKKLIVISDTEYYTGPVSVLKMITGGDFIVGRKNMFMVPST